MGRGTEGENLQGYDLLSVEPEKGLNPMTVSRGREDPNLSRNQESDA